jgi:hypothetical protein
MASLPSISVSGIDRPHECVERCYYGPAAMRLSQHFKEIEKLFSYHLAPLGARFIKVFGQTGDDNL